MAGVLDGVEYRHPGRWDESFEAVSLPELLARSAARTPRAVALDFMGARTRFAALARQVERAAAGFQALGVGRGDKVGLFLPNCPQYVVAYYGALKAGATVVNFSPLYSVEELAAQVEDSGTTTMVCLDAAQLYPTIEAVLGASGLERLIVGSVADALPRAKAVLYRMFRRRDRVRVNWDKRHIPFRWLMRPRAFRPVVIDPHDDVALLQYTGGTTGVPKGAVLTHANLSVNAQQVQAIDPEPHVLDRVLGVLPFFHVFANTAVLNRNILRGAEIVMLPKFEAAAALAAITRRRVTAIPGVPTMFQALLDHPRCEKADFSAVRICISGGAPMPVELQERWERRTGSRLVEGYGLTETSGVVSCNPYMGLRKTGSIGQPLPGTRFVLVDKEDPARPVESGEPGEVTIEGPQVMQCYQGGGRDDPRAFVDGRLRTGDVGTMDEDGYVFVVDRLKDMISVGGFKVFPSRLEDVLYTHPAVKEALVIGTPDARLGERPKAFVALQDGARASADELVRLVNAHVGKHERLAAVEFRDALPKTPIGKLSRKELVAEERATARGEAA